MKYIILLFALPLSVWGQLNEDFWKLIDTKPKGKLDMVYLSMIIDKEDRLYVGTNEGMYRIMEADTTWQLLTKPIPIYHIAIRENNIYCVSEKGTILRSVDGGLTWGDIHLNGLKNITDIEILKNGNILVASCHIEVKNNIGLFRGNGLYRSKDYGLTWEKLNIGTMYDQYISHLVLDSHGRIYASLNEYNAKDSLLIYSNNNGDTWEKFPQLKFNRVDENSIEGTDIVQVTSLTVDAMDSIHLSLQGASEFVATSINLSNSSSGALAGSEWKHMRLVSYGYPWF